MEKNLIYTVRFTKNCTVDVDVLLEFPNGLTQNEYNSIEDGCVSWLDSHEGEEFDIYECVEEVIESLGIGYKYPHVDKIMYL